jgi:hypothetical protein
VAGIATSTGAANTQTQRANITATNTTPKLRHEKIEATARAGRLPAEGDKRSVWVKGKLISNGNNRLQKSAGSIAEGSERHVVSAEMQLRRQPAKKTGNRIHT